MRWLPVVALGLLAALLSATLIAEWNTAEPPPRAPALGVASGAPSGTPAAPAQGGRTAEFAQISLARPLFSPDRRPAAVGAAAASAPDNALPRLTGIMVTPAGRSAIFAGGPRALVVVEGGRVGNFTVRTIEPNQVILLGPDGTRLIRPTFGESKPAAPAALSQSLPQLPVLAPPLGGAGRPLAPSLAADDAPKDAMPFEQNPTPSGMQIFRRQAAGARPQ